ncbi:hypothetical protein BJ170DRAFT_325495 [Xylariales sp. AK1849]|nr:hypothetical protein BJ170DRAFT_325495 [Xylariales sp. AK1849]
MKLNSALTLFAATASAASIRKSRQTTSYEVTKFYANCIPHSTFCDYQFVLNAVTNCTAFLQGPDYLPAVPLQGCEDPAYSFAVALTEGSGLDLTITSVSASDPAANLTGTYAITADELVVTDNGAVQDQNYVGSQNFTVDAVVA